MTAPATAPGALHSPPAPGEFDPYFSRYIDRVPRGDLLVTLTRQLDETVAMLDGAGEARGEYRYAPGKWSIKEQIGHVIDTERVMAYRALWGARGDRTPLPGFEQDDFVRAATFERLSLRELIEHFRLVRLSTLALFRSLSDEELLRRGIANGHEVTPRAIGYIIAGHERHHQLQLREKYGLS